MGSENFAKTNPPKYSTGRKTNIRVARISNMKRIGEGRGLAKNCRDENFGWEVQGPSIKSKNRLGKIRESIVNNFKKK